jgi:hypothetical protein
LIAIESGGSLDVQDSPNLGQALQSAVSLVLRSTANEYFADTPIGLLAEVEC